MVKNVLMILFAVLLAIGGIMLPGVLVQEILAWLAGIFFFVGPFVIPWWLSINGGRWLFTALDPGTGARIFMNGHLVKMEYKDKHGERKSGFVTKGGSNAGVILPFGFRLAPYPNPDNKPNLERRMMIERFDERTNWFSYLSILRHFGIYWIGWPPAQRAWYRFVFTEFSKEPGKEHEIILREEPTNFFFIARIRYAVKVTEVEIGGNQQVDLDFDVYTRTVIPEIAFAETVDVIDQLNATLKAQSQTFFRETPYGELKTAENDANFSENIRSVKLIETLGIEGEEVRLLGPSGTYSTKVNEAQQAKLIAQLEGDAKIAAAEKKAKEGVVKAKGDAKAKNIATDAEVNRIMLEYAEKSKHPDLARYEALAEAGSKGSTIVFEGGGMTPEAKSMLVATDRIRPRNQTDEPQDEADDTAAGTNTPPTPAPAPAPVLPPANQQRRPNSNRNNRQGGR